MSILPRRCRSRAKIPSPWMWGYSRSIGCLIVLWRQVANLFMAYIVIAMGPFMTIKRPAPPVYGPADVFPERPPRGDLQNSLHLHDPGHQAALTQHFGSLETDLVISEMPIGRNLSQRRGLLYPDLLVAFNIDREEAIARMGFSVADQGKAPDFVLEIASRNTALNDYTRKRVGYAEFGVPEYWRFDHTGGQYYPSGLAGDRLVDGVYQPIDVIQTEEGMYRGRSEVLGLDLCWEHGQLRWYNPATESYLLTFNQEREGRIAAEDQRDAAEARVRQLEDELRQRS